jgi:protein pelota
LKIIYRDPRGKEIKLKVENLDDLWHLTNILEPNDLVYGLTYRREEKKDDKLRAERAEKKKVRLGLRVETWKYHDFADILRIHGTIEDAPFDLGSHHTLNVSIETRLTIIKEEWRLYQLERLAEAEKAARQPIVTFLSIDDEKAVIATLHQIGIKHHASVNGPGYSKGYDSTGSDNMNEFYGQIIAHVKQVHQTDAPLILIGPGFFKDELKKFGLEREPELFKNSIMENTNQVGMAGIQEALKRGVVTKLLKDARVGVETEMVERFLIEISKNGRFSYGIEELKNAFEVGAVENLLITNEFIRTPEGILLLDKAKITGAKVMVISTVHEAGKKLSGFGGAGAILRYKM